MVVQENQPPDRAAIPSLAAIVLAGGRSSRMGQDKALIPVKGVPLLQRVCQVALLCTPAVYVVTPWTDRYHAIVPPTCRLIQEHCLLKDALPHGPLIGFAQGLAQVEAEWVLLLACDLPQLQPEPLQRWAISLNTAKQDILLPKSEKGWDPLCGFYHKRCLPRLLATIEQGNRSFQRWLAQEAISELPVHDRTLLFNCNTPKDLEALEQG